MLRRLHLASITNSKKNVWYDVNTLKLTDAMIIPTRIQPYVPTEYAVTGQMVSSTHAQHAQSGLLWL